MRKNDFPKVIQLSSELYEKYAEPDFPVSYTSAYQGLDKLFTNAIYLRVMTENGEVVGWMAAGNGTHQMHSYIRGITQSYYHTSLTGFKAVKALIAFHEDFHKFADKNKFEVAITSSILPTKEIFTKILEKNGWHVSGSRLIRKTSHYPSETCKAANQAPTRRAHAAPLRVTVLDGVSASQAVTWDQMGEPVKLI
jgi:hypothetical protein